MAFLKYKKPITPSQRHLILLNMNHLAKKPLIKQKIKWFLTQNGRNNSGKITVNHKSSGHKKKYRKLNFLRDKISTGIVCSIEYDPNRNSNIAAIYEFSENNFFYIVAPDELKLGDIIKTGIDLEPKKGYSMPLSNIPVDSLIHNIADKKHKKSQISRSAGTFSRIIKKTDKYTVIKLSSGKQKVVSSECYATIGIVSNEFSFLTKLGKAGRSRWLGKRPIVRGVAMNPIDHPHGGGEGKKSGKGKNMWGKTTKLGK